MSPYADYVEASPTEKTNITRIANNASKLERRLKPSDPKTGSALTFDAQYARKDISLTARNVGVEMWPFNKREEESQITVNLSLNPNLSNNVTLQPVQLIHPLTPKEAPTTPLTLALTTIDADMLSRTNGTTLWQDHPIISTTKLFL